MSIVSKVLDFGQKSFATCAMVVTVGLGAEVCYRLYSIRSHRQAFEDTPEGKTQIEQWKLENPDPKKKSAAEQLAALKARGAQPVTPGDMGASMQSSVRASAASVPSMVTIDDAAVADEEVRRQALRRAREDYAKKQ